MTERKVAASLPKKNRIEVGKVETQELISTNI